VKWSDIYPFTLAEGMKIETARILSKMIPLDVINSIGSLYCYLIALIKYPSISSPVYYRSQSGLKLTEYNMNYANSETINLFKEFFYKKDGRFLEKEYQYDSGYFDHSFLYLIQNELNDVVASFMIINKTRQGLLPVEYAQIGDKTGMNYGRVDVGNYKFYNLEGDYRKYKVCEIYRLKKAELIESKLQDLETTYLIFTALLGRVLISNYRYGILTCRCADSGLQNLYMRNLHFKDTELLASYPGENESFRIMTIDFWKQQKIFANFGRKQFAMELYMLSKLRKRSFKMRNGKINRPFSFNKKRSQKLINTC